MNDLLTLKIKSLSSDGRGIGKHLGKTQLIGNALPDEVVVCKIVKKHGSFQEGTAIEIIEKSTDRIEPFCRHFNECGGCVLQHVSENASIAYKQNGLKEQLKHIGKVEPEQIFPPIVGPSYGYRHKARLGVRYVEKKGRLLVGFREKSNYRLADLDVCETLVPEVGQLIAPLKVFLKELKIHQKIAQIEVAVGGNTVALVFRNLIPLPVEDETMLIEFSKKHNIHCYLQPGNPSSVYKIWPLDTSLYLEYYLPDYGLTISFHPLDFIQINPVINRQMIVEALKWLDLKSTDRVLDLFCGVGNFALPMATQCSKVLGVEGSREMVERATENAVRNNIFNIEFALEDLSAVNMKWSFAKEKFDKILLDPPRSGAKELLEWLGTSGASRIVYVSCHPATLARDVGLLVHQYGYTLKAVRILDMFPQTHHVESMALLELLN